MRRSVLCVAMAMTLGACGEEVVVQAQLPGEQGGFTPLRMLEIRALPYDRDSLRQEVAAQYPESEPQMPDSLVALRQQIAQAQETWNAATERWNAATDSVEFLGNALRAEDPSSDTYREMYSVYAAQQEVEEAAQTAMDEAFEVFQQLQNRYAAGGEEFEARHQAWADAAYAQLDSVIAERLDELGREEHVDTTGRTGAAIFDLATGPWWIHATYDLPFEELYWNEPITVTGGGPNQFTLDRSNAEERPIF